MRDVLQLPLESDGAFDFAARVVCAATRSLKPEIFSVMSVITDSKEKVSEESSEEIKRYVEALKSLDSEI